MDHCLVPVIITRIAGSPRLGLIILDQEGDDSDIRLENIELVYTHFATTDLARHRTPGLDTLPFGGQIVLLYFAACGGHAVRNRVWAHEYSKRWN